MAYGMMFELLTNPKAYENKIVKIKGQFSKYFDELEKKTYYTVTILDATECCAIGVEFILKDTDFKDYPEDGTEVEVVGQFITYTENTNTYATLSNAIMKILK